MAKSVFISSTSVDLAEYRAAVDKAIRRLGMRPINMDDFGSQPGGASGVSLREVGKADVFVGIIARRYGYVPDGMEKSVTEQEYDEAVKRRIPRLMYLLDLDADWPEERVEADETAQARLAAFRAKVERQDVRSLFRTPDSLAAQVTADLTKLEQGAKRGQLVTRLFIAIAVLGLLLFGLAAILPDNQRQALIAQFAPPTPTEFAPATEGELLVIVAEFENRNAANMPTGQTMAEQLNDIVNEASVTARNDYGVRLRVARTAEVVTSAERARAISDNFVATMLIWGSVDSAGITTNYTISTPWGQTVFETVEQTNFVASATLDEVAIRFRRTTDQAYVTNFTLGQLLYSDEQYEAALPLFEMAINLMKDEPLAVQREIGMAAAYFDAGYIYQFILEDGGRALPAYSQSLEIDPAGDLAPWAHNNRGIARDNQGDLEGAIADYNRVIELNPEYALAYYNRGIARHQQGDLEGALADYNRAIDLNPRFALAYNNRGIARDNQGDLEGAIADYDRAIELNPEYALAYYNRGIARDNQGDLEGAIADYDRAIELNPEYADAYDNRGMRAVSREI